MLEGIMRRLGTSPPISTSDRSRRPHRRQFANSNAERKPIAKKLTSSFAGALLDSDAQEALLRQAVAIAQDGDVSMLKLLVGRLLPRERFITLVLPRLDFADDAVTALAIINEAVAAGKITPSEASALATLIDAQRRAIDAAEVEKRLQALEVKLSGGK
jgi:hypothetical protein